MNRFIYLSNAYENRRCVIPAPGDVLVYHQYNNGEDVICLYLFRRPEGAYVFMDLEEGVLVDVGRFTEGPEPGNFERWL